jgi:hypothetical protein
MYVHIKYLYSAYNVCPYLYVPELEAAMIAALVLCTAGLLLIGLLLYGTHKVSTRNNRNKYISIIVKFPDFKVDQIIVIFLCTIQYFGPIITSS